MSTPLKTCLVMCDFHAIRSPLTHLVLQKQFPNLNIISAGISPSPREEGYVKLAKNHGFDFDMAPQRNFRDLDLNTIDLAISYSAKGYQILLEQKRYNPKLKIVFWALSVPDFMIKGDKNTTFNAFLDEIHQLANNHLDFLTK